MRGSDIEIKLQKRIPIMFSDYVEKMLPAAKRCFASRIAEKNSLLFYQNDRYF